MRIIVCIGTLFALSVSSAQIKHPKASPFASVHQQIGLTKVIVDYSRPAVRGRKIFGEIVPYGRIWRVGANASTKITVQDTVVVLGNSLPAGTYALYAFPEENEWEIAFHKNTTHWGDGRTKYNAEEDAFRIPVVPEPVSEFQENFLISFDSITHDSAHMVWRWAHLKITIPIFVDTQHIMQAEIEKQLLQNPTAQTYYETARYLEEQRMDSETALAYVNKAIDLGGDTYYFHRVKSLLEAHLGKYRSAVRSATISLELAADQGKDEFVRMNRKNIQLWNKKVKTQNDK